METQLNAGNLLTVANR